MWALSPPRWVTASTLESTLCTLSYQLLELRTTPKLGCVPISLMGDEFQLPV